MRSPATGEITNGLLRLRYKGFPAGKAGNHSYRLGVSS